MSTHSRARRHLAITAIITSTVLLLGGAAMVQHRASRSWSAMQQHMLEVERIVGSRSQQREPLWGGATPGLAFAHYERAVAVTTSIETTHRLRLVKLHTVSDAVLATTAADLRQSWQPAIESLHQGTHTTDTSLPAASTLVQTPHQTLSLLPLRNLANVAMFETRALLHEDHDLAAVTTSLDGATLGLDVIRSGAIVNQMVGIAMLAIALSPWTEERLTRLAPEALRQLEDGLLRLDRVLPTTLDWHGEVLFLARHWNSAPRSELIADVGGTWQYGFSAEWLLADAFQGHAAVAAELDATTDLRWPERRTRMLEAFARQTGGGDAAPAVSGPNMVAGEFSLRAVVAAVRLLRMAVALHRGEDALPLPDPLGDGPLRVETTAEGTRLCSAGTSERPQLERIVRR